MKPLQDYVAAQLLHVKALKLQPHNPFTWANGWESPIYFDSRKILSYPAIRTSIKVQMARVIMEQYPDTEVIAAVAPNAIAMGMMVAELLGLPFVYIHPEPKDHGFENMIEGDLRPRQNVVLIEDQVSIGRNSLRCVDAIRKNGCKMIGLVAIFTYELQKTSQKFRDVDVELTALTNFYAVLRHAVDIGYIAESDMKVFYNWQKDPEIWRQ